MPAPKPFREIRQLLDDNGWKLRGIKGSHHVFVSPHGSLMSIPVHHGMVKYVYYHKVQKQIERGA